MRVHPVRRALAAAMVAVCLMASSSMAAAQAVHTRPPEVVRQPHPIRMTMKELHDQGGVPRRWKFLMPPGDPVAGRKAFVALECYACHAVDGEAFPEATNVPRGTGPDLTGMGSHHPAEYFAESIMNPNRVIVLGPGHTGADSFSKMPSYADVMSVNQLIDVVAYLKSLGTGERRKDDEHATHHGHVR